MHAHAREYPTVVNRVSLLRAFHISTRDSVAIGKLSSTTRTKQKSSDVRADSIVRSEKSQGRKERDRPKHVRRYASYVRNVTPSILSECSRKGANVLVGIMVRTADATHERAAQRSSKSTRVWPCLARCSL
ncbi:hypothetical protein ALC53_03575 [Atta colombica]|uniref:Uncharacterized protein n=1 Tax=Atta colombica TaxID=520822 RepID=A0A151I5S8_9HYME|nr:hypothetical protein ALC53_03575 [Atta colombica]